MNRLIVAIDAEPGTKVELYSKSYVKHQKLEEDYLFITFEAQAKQNTDEHEDIGVHLLVQSQF